MSQRRAFQDDIHILGMRVAVEARRIGARSVGFIGLNRRVGVTTLISRVAADFAALGRAIVVIDANAARPAVHKAFGLPLSPGTMDVLARAKQIEQTLHRLPEAPLSVLPLGKRPDARARFSTEAWRKLIPQTQSEEEIVFVDTGSLNDASSLAVASACDANLLVVDAEQSRWEAVEAVVERLEDLDVKLLGVTVNKRRYSIPGIIYRGL